MHTGSMKPSQGSHWRISLEKGEAGMGGRHAGILFTRHQQVAIRQSPFPRNNYSGIKLGPSIRRSAVDTFAMLR